jgi:aubergine
LNENFEIVLYHVSFETEIEERSTRRKIVREQSELLGNFIYDGNKSLYTFRSLQLQEQNIKFKTSEDVENVLKIEHKGKIDLSSPEALMVMNIIFRRTMSGMNLQLVGRNLYDPQRSVSDSFFMTFSILFFYLKKKVE